MSDPNKQKFVPLDEEVEVSLSDKESTSTNGVVPLDDISDHESTNLKEEKEKKKKSDKDGKGKKKIVLPQISSIGERMHQMEERIGHGMQDFKKDVKLILSSGRYKRHSQLKCEPIT